VSTSEQSKGSRIKMEVFEHWMFSQMDAFLKWEGGEETAPHQGRSQKIFWEWFNILGGFALNMVVFSYSFRLFNSKSFIWGVEPLTLLPKYAHAPHSGSWSGDERKGHQNLKTTDSAVDFSAT